MEEGSIHSTADMNDGLTWLPLVVNISVSPVFCAASFLLSLSSLPDTRVLCAHRRRRNGHSKVTAVLASAIAASALSATSLNRNADDAKAEWKIITRSFVVRNANASVRDHSHTSVRKVTPYLWTPFLHLHATSSTNSKIQLIFLNIRMRMSYMKLILSLSLSRPFGLGLWMESVHCDRWTGAARTMFVVLHKHQYIFGHSAALNLALQLWLRGAFLAGEHMK